MIRGDKTPLRSGRRLCTVAHMRGAGWSVLGVKMRRHWPDTWRLISLDGQTQLRKRSV